MADLTSLERFDGFSGLRNMLREAADNNCEWAGIPMPLNDHKLIIEPKYPHAKVLMDIGTEEPETYDGSVFVIRNTFWSVKLRSTIIVYSENGRVKHGVRPGIHHFTHDLLTLGASVAWGIEQEHHAMQLLGTLVRHHTLKMYLLTGMFLERSERSGVTYMFRRLKPTVAIVDNKKGGMKILCTLCLHPIAYYQGSWAGAMCPTDDVIAHLMLMRGDEPMFWRRANQHAPHVPEAGL